MSHTPGEIAFTDTGVLVGEDGQALLSPFRGQVAANRAHLCLCWNSHDELLEACKAALGAFEHNHAIDWNDLARAIAKATGVQP